MATTILLYGLFQYGWAWWWLLIAFVVYMTVMTVGVMRMRLNFFAKHLHRSPVPTNAIALTFDDGPAAFTQEILATLKRNNVKAAFFLIGKNAAALPEIVKKIAAEGHLIGNHSMYHGHNFDWKTADKMVEEMEEANQALASITGNMPTFFRPPYGITNPAVAKAIRKSGMYSIGWSLRTYDTNFKDKEALLRRTIKLLRGGDVVLLHDSMRHTAAMLEDLITTAQKQGLTFARLDHLLQLPQDD